MITFDHSSEGFFSAIIVDNKPVTEIVNEIPSIILEITMDKIESALDRKQINILGAVKVIKDLTDNPSEYLTCCALSSKTILNSNPFMRMEIAKTMIPAIPAIGDEMLLSEVIEETYEKIKKDLHDESEVVISGIIMAYAGMVRTIADSYNKWQADQTGSADEVIQLFEKLHMVLKLQQALGLTKKETDPEASAIRIDKFNLEDKRVLN